MQRFPHKNEKIELLFVGDPDLGNQGFNIVREYFHKTTCLTWQRGDNYCEKNIRTFISSHRWDILLSCYNDLIFQENELSQFDLALNIHPASPKVRGLGYDTFPLIERHRTFGVTLHRMEKEIDSGPIFDVIEEEIPDNITYSSFNRLTKKLCLKMLNKTANFLSGFSEVADINDYLAFKSRILDIKWERNYYSKKQLSNILNELRIREPNHPVFK